MSPTKSVGFYEVKKGISKRRKMVELRGSNAISKLFNKYFPRDTQKVSRIIDHYANVVLWTCREYFVCVLPNSLLAYRKCAVSCQGNSLLIDDNNLSRHLCATLRRRLCERFLSVRQPTACQRAPFPPLSRRFLRIRLREKLGQHSQVVESIVRYLSPHPR